MSEHSRLYWLMEAGTDLAALRRCLRVVGDEDAVLLLADGVLCAQQAGFVQLVSKHQVYICAEDWAMQSALAEAPAAAKLLSWTEVLGLIRQHRLHQTWI